MMLEHLSGWARRWGWLLLLGLSPAFIFPSPASCLLFLCVPLLLWLQRRGLAGRLGTPYDLAVLVMLAMVLVSAFVTFDLVFSAPKIAGMVLGVGLFYSAAAHGQESPAALRQVLGVYALLGLGISLVGLAGTNWAAKLPVVAPLAARLPITGLSLPGAESGLQPNEVAGVLLWVAPLGLAQALSTAPAIPRGRLYSILFWGAALVPVGVIVLTQSRSGYLGLACGVATVLLLTSRRLRILTLAVVLLAAAAGVVVVAALGPVRAGQAFLGLSPEGSLGVTVGEFDKRLEIWSRAVYAIQDFPLTGMGMNMFRARVRDLYPLFLLDPAKDIGHAHNIWLQAALDLGLPGLVAYLAIWTLTGLLAWRAFAGTADSWLRAAAIGILGSAAGFGAYGMFDAVALGARPGFVMWLLFAAAAAVGRLTDDSALPAAASTAPRRT